MDELIDGMQNILMECEMPEERKQEFRIRYNIAAGCAPNESYLQTQENKWGAEYRIYFDAPSDIVDKLADAGFNIEGRTRGYRADRAYRINNEELFWELIERGLHLGPN